MLTEGSAPSHTNDWICRHITSCEASFHQLSLLQQFTNQIPHVISKPRSSIVTLVTPQTTRVHLYKCVPSGPLRSAPGRSVCHHAANEGHLRELRASQSWKANKYDALCS